MASGNSARFPYTHLGKRPGCLFGVDQGGDRRVVSQLLYAAAAAGPDAPDGDAQPGADLGVRHGRVFEEHGDQALARGWQAGEGLAEGRVALREEQLIFRRPGLLVRDALDVRCILRSLLVPRSPQGPQAFPPSGGDEPARKRGRIVNRVEMVDQSQPDVLADVLGVGAPQRVPETDRPDQRGEPLHKRVPRIGVALSRAQDQISGWRVIAHGCCLPSEGAPAAAFLPNMTRGARRPRAETGVRVVVW